MNELIEEIEKLKQSIDNLDRIKELKKINNEIMKDKELLKNIEKYNQTQDERLKIKIINHKLFREYKHMENECNFLILEINKKLKEIKGNRNCL